MRQSEPDDLTKIESWMVPRVTGDWLDLPVPYRWEVTRRHPYYIRFWERVHRHLQDPSNDPERRSEGASAQLILQAIGVAFDPPAPGTSAEAIGTTGLGRVWEGGAIAPLSYRVLTGMLLTGLPADARAVVGRFLLDSAPSEGDADDCRYSAVSRLYDLRHPALDTLPYRPVVGVNLQAPQKAVTEAIEGLVKSLKEQEGIPERRRREDKLDEYLAVWDDREGWAGDHYDVARELTLFEVAKRHTIPVATATNRYRSAFRLIVGRDHTPELWARVLGFLKVAEWLAPDELPPRYRRTLGRSQNRVDVPESRVAPPAREGSASFLDTGGVSNDEVGIAELLWDVGDLLGRGWTNDAIAQELGLSTPQLQMVIQYLQLRHNEVL